MNNVRVCSRYCEINIVQAFKHGLYSFPHFVNVSHSTLLGIEKRFPIKGSFLGPGGRGRRWRWPLLQYTRKTPRVPRMKASWGSVICLNGQGYIGVAIVNPILREGFDILSLSSARRQPFKAAGAFRAYTRCSTLHRHAIWWDISDTSSKYERLKLLPEDIFASGARQERGIHSGPQNFQELIEIVQ